MDTSNGTRTVLQDWILPAVRDICADLKSAGRGAELSVNDSIVLLACCSSRTRACRFSPPCSSLQSSLPATVPVSLPPHHAGRALLGFPARWCAVPIGRIGA